MITEPVKSFGAPPAAARPPNAAASLSYTSKFLSPRTPSENNPHMVIYDLWSTLIPRSALMNKTLLLFFSFLSLFLFFWRWNKRIDIMRCITGVLFGAAALAGTKSEFPPIFSHFCACINRIYVVCLHLCM